jgi:hypothetical protein
VHDGTGHTLKQEVTEADDRIIKLEAFFVGVSGGSAARALASGLSRDAGGWSPGLSPWPMARPIPWEASVCGYRVSKRFPVDSSLGWMLNDAGDSATCIYVGQAF